MDGFLESVNLKRPPSASRHLHIPAVGTWKKTDIDFWVELYNEIKDARVGGEHIDFGEVAVYENGEKIAEGIEEVIKTAIKYETESKDRSSGGRFSSKLIALEWAKIWVEIDKKKKLKDWCTALYYGAKKEFSSKNGPFLKIY